MYLSIWVWNCCWMIFSLLCFEKSSVGALLRAININVGYSLCGETSTSSNMSRVPHLTGLNSFLKYVAGPTFHRVQFLAQPCQGSHPSQGSITCPNWPRVPHLTGSRYIECTWMIVNSLGNVVKCSFRCEVLPGLKVRFVWRERWFKYVKR